MRTLPRRHDRARRNPADTTANTRRFRLSRTVALCAGSLIVLTLARPTAAQELKTVGESSGFQATAPYADVVEFCEKLADSSPLVHLTSMGQTHEKRDIPLLILADPPIQSAEMAAGDDRPVVFAMANIHAGEVCGKEASLMLARDLVKANSPLLKKLIIVFAPIYNADGNERFSTENRPGQIGPAKGMGQRPNAMGLDLNRDHMKLESPEARALARFMTQWKPIIAMDLHTTDGSFHRFRLTYDSPRHPATDPQLLVYGRDRFLPEVRRQQEQQTGELTFYYGNFDRTHESWHSYPAAPRYSTHYFGLRNCLGILSEAYAYATFEQRVRATYNFVHEILKLAADQRETIVKLVADANSNSARLEELPVRFRPAAFDRQFVVPAWKEEVAGRGRPATDADVEAEYTVRYFGIAESTLDIDVPFAYVIPGDQPKAVENLTNHGVQLQRLSRDFTTKVQRYGITGFDRARRAFQGHKMVSDVEVTATTAEETLPAGSVIVRTDQPLARLIVNLLEPQSADGLCTWNFFDKSLEQQQYPILRINESVEIPKSN